MDENNEDGVLSNKENGYICKLCKKTFKHQSSHSRHLSTCGQAKAFKCKICTTEFKRKDALKRHQEICQPKVAFECHLCDKKFQKNWMLQRHLKKVNCVPVKGIECPHCKKLFKREINLSKHLHTNHYEEVGVNFIVQLCDESETLENEKSDWSMDSDGASSEDNMYMSMVLDENGFGARSMDQENDQVVLTGQPSPSNNQAHQSGLEGNLHPCVCQCVVL